MNKYYMKGLALGLSLMSAYVVGGSGTLSSNSDALVTDGPSVSKAFVGLNWSLGGSATPELILGWSNGRTKADGNVRGSKISAHFDLESGFTPSKVKAAALFGQPNVMAELGAGYDFLSGELVGVVGLNSGNLAVGVDVNMDMELSPYAGFLTIGAFPSAGLICAGLPETKVDSGETLELVENAVPSEFGQCLYEYELPTVVIDNPYDTNSNDSDM